jgi:mannitol 2-dehydrogenase
MSNVSRLRPEVGVPLSNATLSLHANRLSVPTYDRSALAPSIVHIGVGGFHRAHQAVYLDDLAHRGVSRSWGIVGVGLHRRTLKDALTQQDCLYTVVERGAGVERGRVVGSLVDYLYAREEGAQVLAALTDERTRIVTLTITGNGYHLDPRTGVLDTESEPVRADCRRASGFETAWGYLAEALAERRRRGLRPFTVMSCDNVADNGGAARTALVTFAGLRDPGLARWIDAEVAFPSTMVDRITPKTSVHDRDAVQRRFGIADRCPVMTEPFTQWIVEDQFCNGRPPLDEVGVELVSDVSAHKLVKTRLLNGVHCAISYLGILAGYTGTAEAMADPMIYRYVDQLMRDEIAPLLPEVPGWNMLHYRQTLLARLTNPQIDDHLSRLAARGSMKMPAYLLPSLHEARAKRRPHSLLTLALAAWLRYLCGYDSAGNPITVEDQRAAQLTTMAKCGQADARQVLCLSEVFGDLGDDEAFTRRVTELLRDIDRLGALAALRRSIDEPLTHAVAT